MRLAAKIGVGALALAGALTACSSVGSGPQEATVAKVVDGNTIDVTVDGTTEHIQLLNIDTPDTAPLNGPAQCLGPEAAQYLTTMLPVGTPVRVEFDAKPGDDLGHNFAALFTQDGKMVNAEVARAGFAQVVTADGNMRFRPPVEQAAQEAVDNKVGLHSANVPCTFPGRVAAVGNSVAQSPTLAVQPPDANSHVLYTAAGLAFVAVSTARSLLNDIDHAGRDVAWAILTAAEQTQLRAQAQTSADTVNAANADLQSAANAAKAMEDLSSHQDVQVEADRVAREQVAAQAAEQQRAAAETQRQATAQRQQEAAEQRQQAAAQRAAEAPSRSGSSTGPHTGQTGHPCVSGERDGDHDGYCGEGR